MVIVVTRYQWVHFSLTRDAVCIESPVSILGAIPIRQTRLEVPLPELQGIRMAHKLIPSRLLVVAVLVTIPLMLDLPRYFIGATVALEIWFMLLTAIGTVEVRHAGGRSSIPVCLLQRRTIQSFIEKVRRAADSLGTARP